MYKNCFKRLIDFTLALFGLICVSPILLVVTVLLHFANKGAGAFFFQERPGLNGKIFKILKFKTWKPRVAFFKVQCRPLPCECLQLGAFEQ
jgi:lipopolysaccharide/colanic/teichoic acid biosynthesis glycosyltransferase